MTPTAAPPQTAAPANGTPHPPAPSPVEYVRALPPEDKHAVFLALIREALEHRTGTGLLPVVDEHDRPFGYYVPPKAAQFLFDQQRVEMPPEVREQFDRPVTDLDNCISSDEMLATLRRAAGAPPA